jgi:hypothetical protein
MLVTKSETINEVVRKVLAEEFKKIEILEVRVSHDLDGDGDKILRLNIIFEGSPKDVDSRKLLSLVRYMIPKLEEIDEDAFPLISFISAFDAGVSTREPT